MSSKGVAPVPENAHIFFRCVGGGQFGDLLHMQGVSAAHIWHVKHVGDTKGNNVSDGEAGR